LPTKSRRGGAKAEGRREKALSADLYWRSPRRAASAYVHMVPRGSTRIVVVVVVVVVFVEYTAAITDESPR